MVLSSRQELSSLTGLPAQVLSARLDVEVDAASSKIDLACGRYRACLSPRQNHRSRQHGVTGFGQFKGVLRAMAIKTRAAPS